MDTGSLCASTGGSRVQLDHDVALATPPVFADVAATAARVIEIGGPALFAVADRAQPTAPMMRALADELERARTAPRSVAHPELVDPDKYWELALWPQAAATVRDARSVLVQVAAEMHPIVEGSERVLEDWLDELVVLSEPVRAADPVHARDVVIDAIANACQALHRTVDMIRALSLDCSALDQLTAEVLVQRRRRAEAFVRALDAGLPGVPTVDPAGFEARVAARNAELAAEVPFRHEDLALAAHRQARTAINAEIANLVEALTAPILGIGERLVARYDRLTSPRPAD
jgi:hypothetical protein